MDTLEFKEEWKDIKGYDGIYKVSSKGRVSYYKKGIKESAIPKDFILRKLKIPGTTELNFLFHNEKIFNLKMNHQIRIKYKVDPNEKKTKIFDYPFALRNVYAIPPPIKM